MKHTLVKAFKGISADRRTVHFRPNPDLPNIEDPAHYSSCDKDAVYPIIAEAMVNAGFFGQVDIEFEEGTLYAGQTWSITLAEPKMPQ